MTAAPRSPLDRALQLHVAALAFLGATFVGLRHQTPAIPAAAAVAVVAAYFLTDALALVRLNRWLANGIILAAVIVTLRDFLEVATAEEKLLAIASMLCYLQMVLMFQEKTGRTYWQLVVLSALEVVVAAALDLGPQFGLLLAVYAATALSMLVLLCLHRELERAMEVSKPARMKKRESAAKRSPWEPLTAEPSVSVPMSLDTSQVLTAPILFRQTALLAAVTLVFAMAFFFSAPRLNERNWLGGAWGRTSVTGFKPEVRLDQRGRLHQSNQAVMRVSLSKSYPERRSLELIAEPYFHGALLTEFRAEEGRWLPWRPPGASDRPRVSGMIRASVQTTTSLARQDIVLESSGSGPRFAIMPAQPIMDNAATSGGTAQYWPERGPLPRQRYSLATPAIVNDRQLRGIPNPNRALTPEDDELLTAERARALEIDRDRYPRLIQTAEQVIAEHELERGKPLEKALVLERHFLAAGAYRYSLNLDFPVDPAADTSEDFVSNHRTGRCEQFASALALMLRSQGIPARLVVGYKGGEFNSIGRYYLVEQRHAHSWVEALVPTDDVPVSELAGNPSRGGVWYRLDPTPGRSTSIAIAEEGVGTRVMQTFDYVELLWRDYVLSLSKNQQEEFVYQPITARATVLPAWVEPRGLQRWLRRLSAQWGMELPPARGSGGARAFEGSLAILVIGGLLLAVIGAQGLRLLWNAAARWRRRAARVADGGEWPKFYRRLERQLARLGVVRRAGQTPRELAAMARPRLMALEGGPLCANVPGEIVSAYYRVRYGGHRLDNQEALAIEQALAALDAAVRQKRTREVSK